MGGSEEVAHHFGRNMKRLRKQAGVSQEALGFLATLHRTEIGLLERGERCPRIDTLIKVATALGVGFECGLLEGISWSTGRVTTKPGAFALAPAEEPGEG